MSIDVQNFQEDVIEASSKVPVVVDFWAEWCGPCRILGPVLERLEAAADGSWILAKLDTDSNPQISMQYGIRGIPAVKLFIDGTVVNEFTGALPEHMVRSWLDASIPTEEKGQLDAAKTYLESGEHDRAKEILESLLSYQGTQKEAAVLLAGVILFEDPERAAELAATAADEPSLMQMAEGIQELVNFMSKQSRPDQLSDEDGKEEYLSASAALADGNLEAALTSVIDVIQKNRYFDDDGARKMGIALFAILGDTHPLSKKYRRTFDMWLY